MSEWTEEQQTQTNEAIVKIAKKAGADPSFRKLCLSDPAAAFKSVSSVELPSDFNLRFVSNEEADLSVVLPDIVASGQQISDTELEQVSGGLTGFCAISCAGSCAVTTTLSVGVPGVGGAACA